MSSSTRNATTTTSTTENGSSSNAASAAAKTKSILKTEEKPTTQTQFPTFRVDLKYRNTLPSVPFDPYFLEIPVPADFLWGFKQSTLEKNYKYRIHMNPPQLHDDMIDPLGAEEWAKAIEFDERDKSLQRKDGVEATAKANKHSGANREAKTWMLRTIYTRENVHRQSSEGSIATPVEPSNLLVIEENEEARRDLIEKQFHIANSGEAPKAPLGKEIKRVLPFLPSRLLREIKLHLIRFKVGEKIMKDDLDNEKDDEWIVNRAILLHRNEQQYEDSEKPGKEFSPLSLFLPKKIENRMASARDEEEDLFAEDVEASPEVNTTSKGATYDTKHVEYIREYQTKLTGAKNIHDRFALIFEEDAVRYAELEEDSLRLFRIKQPGDDERIQHESNVELTVNLDVSKEEKRKRSKRRKTIEGGDLDLE
jgi:hypothetical protein